jgi:hypothetical protein
LVFTNTRGRRYTGEQLAGRPEGKGKKIYSDGGWYEGDWAHGERHGEGVKVDASGDRYEGEWVKDYREGAMRAHSTNRHAGCSLGIAANSGHN